MTASVRDRRLGARVTLGVVVVALVWAACGLSGVSLASDPFQSGATRVSAIFPRAVGLYPKSRVQIDGMDAGWVDQVKPELGQVRVVMHFSGVALAANATASLRLKSIIGERYVELAPVWTGAGPRLTSGTVIPQTRVQVPAEISDVLDQFTRLAQGVDKQALGQFVHELAVALDDRHDALSASVANFAATSRVLDARAGDIDRSLTNLQQVIGNLASRDNRIVDLMRSAGVVSDALLAQDGALDGSINGIDRLLQQVSTLAVTQKQHLSSLLDSLDRVGTVLAAHSNDFASVVNQLPYVAYSYIRAVNHDGDRWYTINYPEGILFLPTAPAINSSGGPGSDRSDHRFLPGIDNSGSPVAQAMPHSIDLTQVAGNGPLLPSTEVGPHGVSPCPDPNCGEAQ